MGGASASPFFFMTIDQNLVAPFKFPGPAHEYKVTSLRECPLPESLQLCETPAQAAQYWDLHIATHPYFNRECECLAVLILNIRRKIKGHALISIGTQDSLLIHPREVFRLAVVTNANAIIVMHNHPSGDPSPSYSDITATRDLVRAGETLKIELLDHVIMGANRFQSLRHLGHFSQ